MEAWEGFKGQTWKDEINVRDFIQQNYTPYEGDGAFLAGATERTNKLMGKLSHLFDLEQQFGGVLDIDTQHVTSLLNYKPGYLDKKKGKVSALPFLILLAASVRVRSPHRRKDPLPACQYRHTSPFR